MAAVVTPGSTAGVGRREWPINFDDGEIFDRAYAETNAGNE
jgi:hypothetical protein